MSQAQPVTSAHGVRAPGSAAEGPTCSPAVALLAIGRRGHRFDIGDRSWQSQANCLGVDPELFFPERGASTREAKAVCRACIVQSDCLEYAIVNGEKFGIWGGLSERERRRIRRARSITGRRGVATA